MSTEFFNDQWRIPNNKNKSLVSNYSMEFNGINTFVDLSVETADSVPSRISDWTYSAWLYLDSTVTGSVPCIFERGAPYPGAGMIVGVKNTDKSIYAYTGGTTATNFTSITLPTNEWAFFALVYDVSTNELTCYINNSSQTLTAPNWSISGTLLNIGKRQNSTSSYFWKGKMSQVSIFNYALQATGTNSIATLYSGGTAVTNPMALSPKPVAYYQLGEQSVDNGAYLVPNNSLQDYVFDFDGTNQAINLNSAIALTGNRSVNFWFTWRTSGIYLGGATSGVYYPFILSQTSVYLKTSGVSNTIVTIPTLQLGVFYNMCITGDGTTVSVYINAVLAGTGTDIANITLDTIANTKSPTTNGANGNMSNMAIWTDTVLSQAEVTEIYNSGVPLNLNDFSGTAPESWYKLNTQDTFDGTNWTINDYIGSNDGTSVNMTSANLVQSNLQHTSGYSPYALNFDGTNQEFDIPSVPTLELYNTDFSISFWCKVDASATNPMFFEKYEGGGGWSLYVNTDRLRFYTGNFWTYISGAFQTVYAGLWTNVTVVGDLASTNLKCYINGNEVHSSTNTLIQIQNTDILTMAGSNAGSFSYAGGLSNVAIWSGTALSAAQVTEVYNQGVPINLNTFSGNKPNHWWQLGSNSSFNSNSWTCLDEGISSSISPLTSAVSTANMANDDIINGVGYTANGLGASTIDILGDAPYSTANGLSENMDVLDRTTDIPPTV